MAYTPKESKGLAGLEEAPRRKPRTANPLVGPSGKPTGRQIQAVLDILREDPEEDIPKRKAAIPPRPPTRESKTKATGPGRRDHPAGGVLQSVFMALALVWLAGGLSITFFSQGVLGGMDLGAVFFTFSTWWLVFLLLLRPGLPLILWDMLRNRAEYSEWSMINEITVLIDVSKIARVNLSALKEIIGFIDNPMIATGLRMMLLNSERATMDSRLREIANGELDHIEREIKTLRLGAWGTLGASVLLLALLFGLGIGEGLAHEMMAALIAVTGFVVLFLLEQLHSIHLEIYRRRVNLIHDGLTAIAEKREPAEIEENLLKYFSRKSRKLYEGMKFPSA